MIFLLVNNEDILKVLGKNIKKVRKEKGYTQDYVAEQINISTDLLRSIENGRNIGSITTLLNICNFLQVSPIYFGLSYISKHILYLLFIAIIFTKFVIVTLLTAFQSPFHLIQLFDLYLLYAFFLLVF